MSWNTPIRKYYTRYNGTSWDVYYFYTDAGAVAETDGRKFLTKSQYELLDFLVGSNSPIYDVGVRFGNAQKQMFIEADDFTVDTSTINFLCTNDFVVGAKTIKFQNRPQAKIDNSYENMLTSSDISAFIDNYGQSSAKFKLSYMPDAILGQVKYGGVVASGGKLTLTSSARTILGDALGKTATASTTDVSGTLSSLTDSEGYYTYSGTVNIGTSKTNVTISGGANYCSYNSSTGVVSYTLRGTTGGTTAYATISYYEEGAIVNNYITDINTTDTRAEGIYFMVASGITNVTIAGITGCSTGDWLIITGGAWTKIDNTDAVTMVNNQHGNVETYKGEFVAEQVYYKGDIVKYNGDFYMLDLNPFLDSITFVDWDHATSTTGTNGCFKQLGGNKIKIANNEFPTESIATGDLCFISTLPDAA